MGSQTGNDRSISVVSHNYERKSMQFDMLVCFDEAKNTIADLERTLGNDWYSAYARKIIIVDVTGFGKRQNLALQYLKSREHPVRTLVDSSSVYQNIDQRDDTIRRLSKQVKSPFFMVIPAGNTLFNLESLAKMIQHISSRVIHWSFPFSLGSTAITPQQLHYGLFITAPYLALMKSPQVKSFTKELRREEEETGMGLSWLCNDVWLSHDD